MEQGTQARISQLFSASRSMSGTAGARMLSTRKRPKRWLLPLPQHHARDLHVQGTSLLSQALLTLMLSLQA
jgi:hypothetical protein